METIISKHRIDAFNSVIFRQYFGDMNMVVFDIETTGLNPEYCEIILAGTLKVSPDGDVIITQYFAEAPGEESALLGALIDDLNSFDGLLTYNGKHFDVPFIKKRCQKLRFCKELKPLYNLDLYLVLNGHSDIKHILKNLKQKTIEEYLGLSNERNDEISGSESVELYNTFLKEKNCSEKEALKKSILLHNHDDVLQLYKLQSILKQCDLHKALNVLGFPIGGINGWPNLIMQKCHIKGSAVEIKGIYSGTGLSYESYFSLLEAYSAGFETEGTFVFHIPVEKNFGAVYVDLKKLDINEKSLSKYPGFVDGYFILSSKNMISYGEFNAFITEFLRSFMSTHEAPAYTFRI